MESKKSIILEPKTTLMLKILTLSFIYKNNYQNQAWDSLKEVNLVAKKNFAM